MSDESQTDPTGDGVDNGVAGLRRRRAERVRRQAPPPRHPRQSDVPAGEQHPAPAEVVRLAPPPAPSEEDEQRTVPQVSPQSAAEMTREIAPEIPREVAAETPVPVTPAVEPAESPEVARPAADVTAPPPPPPPAPTNPAPVGTRTPLPDLGIDLDDPAALAVTPTVLSVASSIMRRFEAARANAPSHTALVLDALRAHTEQLPELVLAARPGLRPGDLFPWRASPGASRSDRPEPLRIRPMAGELGVIDALVGWTNAELQRLRPGGRKASRSEVVAAALNAHLPQRGSAKSRR